jgi:hypothetical protein
VSEEEEGFAGVATAALNGLLLGLETRLDACLGSLMRCNWAATESVSVPFRSAYSRRRRDGVQWRSSSREAWDAWGPSDSLSPADQSCVMGWRFQRHPHTRHIAHKGPSLWAQTGWAVMISTPFSCLDPACRVATGRHFVVAMNRALHHCTDRLSLSRYIQLQTGASSGLQVGDQSDFVTAMGRTLQEFGPPLGAALPEHHFAFLCDKVPSHIT